MFKPAGSPTVSPYLSVLRPDELVSFLVRVFEARETARNMRADGSIQHVEVRIDDSVIMIGGRDHALPNAVHVYVANVDEVYQRAMALMAESIVEPRNMPYGERVGGFKDPSGTVWWVATHKA